MFPLSRPLNKVSHAVMTDEHDHLPFFHHAKLTRLLCPVSSAGRQNPSTVVGSRHGCFAATASPLASPVANTTAAIAAVTAKISLLHQCRIRIGAPRRSIHACSTRRSHLPRDHLSRCLRSHCPERRMLATAAGRTKRKRRRGTRDTMRVLRPRWGVFGGWDWASTDPVSGLGRTPL